MKDISKIKKKLQDIFAKKFCNILNAMQCKRLGGCTCSMAALTQAYIYTVIPLLHQKASIYDLTGQSKLKLQLVDSRCIVLAKKKIVLYCWGSIDLDSITKQSELDSRSIMTSQRIKGRNVVIFAESSDMSYLNRDNAKTKPRGKTLCASIIMKLAIKSRMIKGFYSQSFDWISYSVLADRIFNKDLIGLANLKSADWLVIDNINLGNGRAHAVDPLITQRIDDGLPTIFVCRFNVMAINSLLKIGSGLSQVLHDKNTLLINLSGNTQ